MIRKISFSNFYSFKSKQSISFLTSKKKSYDYVTSKNTKGGYKEQITKVAGIISKNAAGKTNIVRALGFIGFFATAKASNDANLLSAYKTFFNNKEESNFCIEFEIDDEIYEYSFSLSKGLVKKEQLKYKNDIVYNFSEGKKLVLNEAYSMDAMPEKTRRAFKRNMSFIAYTNSTFDVVILARVIKFFENFTININELGQRTGEIIEAHACSREYKNNIALKKKMEKFINNFDLGPKKRFNINIKDRKRNDGSMEKLLELYSVNSVNGNDKKILFEYESTGTRMIYYMLAKLFFVLKNNGTLILDEIEIGLHPEALSKLIQYFIDENAEGNAQLIFSTHSLDFLKSFKKDQVFLVERNDSGESSVKRLDKKIVNGRTEDNLFAKYKSGLYGSYPDIRV